MNKDRVTLGISQLSIDYKHSKWDSEIPMSMVFDGPDPRNYDFDMSRPANPDSSFFGNKAGKGRCKLFVGLNGSGKTTLLKTIRDFYSTQNSINGPYIPGLEAMKSEWNTMGVQFFRSSISLNCSKIESIIDAYRGFPDRDVVVDKFLNSGLAEEEYQMLIAQEDESEDMRGMVHEWVYDNFDIMKHCNLSIELISEIDLESNKSESSITVDFSGIWMFDGLTIHEWDESEKINFENPFGPNNIKESIVEILTKMEDKTEIDSELFSDIEIVVPKINPVYLEARNDSQELEISDELFDCIEDSLSIEDFLETETEEKIDDYFQVKKNKEYLRTYEKWEPDPDCGSDEFLRRERRKLMIERIGEEDVDSEISIQPTIMKDSKMAMVSATLAKFSDENSQVATYHSPKRVFQCELPEKGSNSRIHRWQKSVIYCEDSKLIYSENKSHLHDYLKRDLWRNIELSNRNKLLSNIFGVDSKKLTALSALNELSLDINNYLTSGQTRVFSIIEKSIEIESAEDNYVFLLLDEPEVSLHIDWQRNIIDLVMKYTDAKYILAATHSPDIIYHHLSQVVELNPIIDD
jgi:energy-coupling factor transporter ATP-binding protein EcfA2